MQEKHSITLMWLVCLFLAFDITVLAQTNIAPNAGTNIETNAVSDVASTNALSLPSAAQPARRTLDVLHRNVSSNIVALVRRFDRFFQDPSLMEENNDTRISVGLGVSRSRKDRSSLANEISARIALPNLQQRLQIIADNMLEVDEPASFRDVSTAARESRPDTGLRYIFSKDRRFRITGDAGLRVGSPSEVFGKLRGRYTVPFEHWESRLTQNVQWYSLDGFAETSTMRWSRILKHDRLLQSSSAVTWNEMLSGVTLSQVFSLSKALTETQGYEWTISGVWPETPKTREAVYAIEHSYRRLIYSDWLFVEFRPGIEFPQVDKFEPNPMVTLLIDCVFAAQE